ncbi:MAG: winged helix-turn-helix transcriptional regulator [Rhodospirillales bacterium]|nr:winged helix-turn-helix transcriptional regulator [Rhodospirillales bacterium]
MDNNDTQQDTDMEQPPVYDDPAYAVLVAVRGIIRAANVQSKWVAKTCGLTTPQVVILQAVQDLGEVTSARVAEQVELSPATVATVMDRLEKRDLIERYRSDKDRRIVHSRLTAFGQQALGKAPPLVNEKFTDAFSLLAIGDQRKVVHTLEEVAKMLDVGDSDVEPNFDLGPPVAHPEKP